MLLLWYHRGGFNSFGLRLKTFPASRSSKTVWSQNEWAFIPAASRSRRRRRIPTCRKSPWSWSNWSRPWSLAVQSAAGVLPPLQSSFSRALRPHGAVLWGSRPSLVRTKSLCRLRPLWILLAMLWLPCPCSSRRFASRSWARIACLTL